jgi:hypothetical protein
MIVSARSAPFAAVHNEGDAGLVGDIEVRMDDNRARPQSANVVLCMSVGIRRLPEAGVSRRSREYGGEPGRRPG